MSLALRFLTFRHSLAEFRLRYAFGFRSESPGLTNCQVCIELLQPSTSLECGQCSHRVQTALVLSFPSSCLLVLITLKNRLMETYEYTPLVVQAQAGDQRALNELIEQFEPTVYAIVLRRLRNPSEALEVSQEVFIRAIRKLPQLREPERFAGWLRQIAVRLAINRAVRRPKEQAQDPETFDFCAPTTVDVPLDQLLQGERAEHVRDGLLKLRELDRETLIAFYFEGESIQQMSERFNSPVGTIKRRLHTARHRLKEHLLDCIPV